MTLVLGLIGENGSGKGTLVDFLRETDLEFTVVSPAEKLRRILETFGVEVSRPNLQKLALTLMEEYGDDVHARGMSLLLRRTKMPMVVYDAVRTQLDVAVVESMNLHIFVYITAPRELRFERMKERKEKAGEGELTWGEFLQQESSKIESHIPIIGRKALFRYCNDGTLNAFEDFAESVHRACVSALS